MEALEAIKATLSKQTNFLERFKKMNVTQRFSKKFSAVAATQESSAANSSVRRTLIDRQQEYVGINMKVYLAG